MRGPIKRRLLKGLRPPDPTEAVPEPIRSIPMGGYGIPANPDRLLRPGRQTVHTWDDVWHTIDRLRQSGANLDEEMINRLRMQNANGDAPPTIDIRGGGPVTASPDPPAPLPFIHVPREQYDEIITLIQDADSIQIYTDAAGNTGALMTPSGDDPGLHAFIDDQDQCWVHPDAYAYFVDQTMADGTITDGVHEFQDGETIMGGLLRTLRNVGGTVTGRIPPIDPIINRLAERAVQTALERINIANSPGFAIVSPAVFQDQLYRFRDLRRSAMARHIFYYCKSVDGTDDEQLIGYREDTSHEDTDATSLWYLRNDFADFFVR